MDEPPLQRVLLEVVNLVVGFAVDVPTSRGALSQPSNPPGATAVGPKLHAKNTAGCNVRGWLICSSVEETTVANWANRGERKSRAKHTSGRRLCAFAYAREVA